MFVEEDPPSALNCRKFKKTVGLKVTKISKVSTNVKHTSWI